MKNIKNKIHDVVEISLKPDIQSIFDVVGSEIYNKVNNRTSMNEISFLTKSRVFIELTNVYLKKNKQ